MKDGVRLAVGFFDGVHLGHQKILSGANAVLTFENHPLSVLADARPPMLLMDASERLRILASEGAKHPRDVRAIRFTRGFASRKPEEFAEFLRSEYPALECIHCGGNWRFGAQGAGTPATLRTLGFNVKVCRYAKYKGERVSSTRIRAALAEGFVEDANAMLGRPFAVTGAVMPGKGVGKDIGAPTLNLSVALPLKHGVYAVETQYGGGVANYGVAPTMGRMAWTKPVLEVHLFDGEAIGTEPTLRVAFLSFLRPEMVFSSSAALGEQIRADIAAASFQTAPCPDGMFSPSRARDGSAAS